MTSSTGPRLGATYLGHNQTEFLVWAPRANKVELRLVDSQIPLLPMNAVDNGYRHAPARAVGPGARYWLNLDGKNDRPDPASRYQPAGVHGPSQIIETEFRWEDAAWKGPALQDYVPYELHTGAFTQEGTFEAIIPQL